MKWFSLGFRFTLDLDAMVAVVLPACTAFEFELACTLAADPGYAAVLSHVAPVADTCVYGKHYLPLKSFFTAAVLSSCCQHLCVWK